MALTKGYVSCDGGFPLVETSTDLTDSISMWTRTYQASLKEEMPHHRNGEVGEHWRIFLSRGLIDEYILKLL